MSTISLTLPSDGQTIDASDVNNPLNTIAAEINGNLDNSNIKAGAAIDRSKIAGFTDGWEALGYAPSTVTANGNRSYDLVFSSVDLTSNVSPGMRLKLTRTVTAPTQCTDLEAGSSQYYSKTSPSGLSFTDDFTVSAWIKPESYTGGGIIARRNADTEGWSFAFNSNGTLEVAALRIAGNNSVTTSYQSLPLNKWSHVAATVDLSGTSVLMYIDGVLVPSTTTVTGTCTALVQGTTALVVGAYKSAGTAPFDGKIAQASVHSAVLSAATIKAMMNQTLDASANSIVSGYTFNNTLNDITANANNLTAQGSAVATNADTPFTQDVTGTSVTAGTTNYAIITKTAFSTNTTLTVQVPEGDTIPTSGGVSAVSYSTQKVPYGFPAQKSKWMILGLHMTADPTTSNASYGAFLSGGWQLVVPPGAWKVGYTIPGAYNVTTTTIYFGFSPSALTGLTHAQGAAVYNSIVTRILSPSAAAVATTLSNSIEDTFSTTQTFIMYTLGSTTSAGADGNTSINVTFAECAYL